MPVETRIVEKAGRYEVWSADGKQLYGSYAQRERAERRSRHVRNSSQPRREKRQKVKHRHGA